MWMWSLSRLSASCDDMRRWNADMLWSEGDDVGIVTQCWVTSDLPMICQKDNHLLLDQGWPWVTETTESKTTDNGGLLQFHNFQLRDPWATRSHIKPPSKVYHTKTHYIFMALRRDNLVRQIGDGFSNQRSEFQYQLTSCKIFSENLSVLCILF